LRAGAFAYRDRRINKRNFRSLWIVRNSLRRPPTYPLARLKSFFLARLLDQPFFVRIAIHPFLAT
jgi:hypothetical protein